MSESLQELGDDYKLGISRAEIDADRVQASAPASKHFRVLHAGLSAYIYKLIEYGAYWIYQKHIGRGTHYSHGTPMVALFSVISAMSSILLIKLEYPNTVDE